VRLLKFEFPAVLLVSVIVLVAVPLALGGLGVSWDALNHHIYLGWTAEGHRFGKDFLAASYQSYQFPYLYWPVYKLSSLDVPGAIAGAALNSMYILAVPPLWKVARRCVPGDEPRDVVLRMLGVALAATSGVALSLLDATSNDLLAAIPLLWSVAWALEAAHGDEAVQRKNVVKSAAAAGLSVAFKLSNGPLAILLPGIWIMAGRRPRERFTAVVLGCLTAAAAFLVTYGYWGWQLWKYFGNPVFPFYEGAFAVVRNWAGWHP
jgi:hypothetical protein